MRLLVDTDVFCKLGVACLFDETLSALKLKASDCGRLPALPYMLRRGSLPNKFGSNECNALIPAAERFAVIGTPDAAWFDLLAPIQVIDPGEAQIFAMAAQHSLTVLTGDKRALRAIKDVPV